MGRMLFDGQPPGPWRVSAKWWFSEYVIDNTEGLAIPALGFVIPD